MNERVRDKTFVELQLDVSLVDVSDHLHPVSVFLGGWGSGNELW